MKIKYLWWISLCLVVWVYLNSQAVFMSHAVYGAFSAVAVMILLVVDYHKKYRFSSMYAGTFARVFWFCFIGTLISVTWFVCLATMLFANHGRVL